MPSSRPQGYGRGCLIQLVVSVVGVLVIGPYVLLVAWAANNVEPGSVEAIALLIAAPTVLIGGMVIAALAFGIWNRRRIARWMDEAMAPLGATGAPLMLLGRSYTGHQDGRAFYAQFNRGPRFDLFLDASAHTRATLTHRSGNAAHPTLEAAGLTVKADEPAWAERLLAAPGVCDALVRLGSRADISWRPKVQIRPDVVHLQLHRVGMGALTAERISSWHADLAHIASAIDAAAPPAERQVATKLEDELTRKPAQLALRVSLWTALVLAILTLGVLALSGLIVGLTIAFS